MILKLKSELPSTSIWYDMYSAQESLQTKAMVYHGQVGGEGQLSLSQTVFFFIFSIKFLSLLSYLIAFLSYCFLILLLSLFSFSLSVSHGQVGGEGQLGLSHTLCFSL